MDVLVVWKKPRSRVVGKSRSVQEKAVLHQALRSGTEQPVPWSSPKQLGFVPSPVLPPVPNT